MKYTIYASNNKRCELEVLGTNKKEYTMTYNISVKELNLENEEIKIGFPFNTKYPVAKIISTGKMLLLNNQKLIDDLYNMQRTSNVNNGMLYCYTTEYSSNYCD